MLTSSDRPSELSGTLQGPAGAPATDYFVIVLPVDRAMWIPESRRVQATRPGTDGRFIVHGLPGGEYLIAALTDVEPDEWNDPALLAQIALQSVKVTVRDGERTVQDLRLR